MARIMRWRFVVGFTLLHILFTTPCVYGLDTPKISIAESVWDIGIIELEEEVTHLLGVYNVGSEELKITQVRSSCSCLQVEITSDIIQPGEHSDIKAVFKEDERLGEIIKTIYIDSNDPDVPHSTIRVKAIVVSKENASPQKTEASAESTIPIEIQASQDGSVCFVMFS